MTAAMVASGAHKPQLGGSFRDYATAADSNLVDIDIGASFGGYSVDTARSFYVGEPTEEIVAQYEVVRAAYDAAEAVTRAGVPAEAVHAACADVISAAGFNQSWKVGHGVGLADGHEAPLLQPGNATALEPDMVFTIDPGFFVARNLPLHLEETVRVTETGCERLTSYPLDLVVI
jgi:Xaa-Pro aminopeptidase